MKDAIKQLSDKQVYIWIDNRPALSWCSQIEPTNRFVYNRVTNIRRLLPEADIRYVCSEDNPADILTRDISAEDLLKSKSWWHATQWIIQEDWKKENNEYKLHPEITDFNCAQQEEVNLLLEECFNNTPGDFYDKLRKYSLYKRLYSIYRENKEKSLENTHCTQDGIPYIEKIRRNNKMVNLKT